MDLSESEWISLKIKVVLFLLKDLVMNVSRFRDENCENL